jgi:phage shock protein C
MNEAHGNDHDNPSPVPPQPSTPEQPQQTQHPHGFPHPQPGPPPPPPPSYGRPAADAPVQDDVWGVRPPALGPQPTSYPQDGVVQGSQGQPGYGQPGHGSHGAGSGPGSSHLDRGLSALQKSPLRRDTDAGIVGGVAAGIAQRLNVSTAAVRLATVALALFFGSGIAAYLIAWALLPDQSGRTHVEQGVKGGNAQSLIISVLAGLAALGMVASVLDGLGWLVPVLVTAGIVGYVVHAGKKKKGDGTS